MQKYFCVTRQLFYSKDNSNSIDVMVSLNGMPVMTMELKNHYTNQTVENAIRQYQTDRDASDPLLVPKRCAVHFAVDDDNIRMCTWLCGKSSWFYHSTKVSMVVQVILLIPMACAHHIFGRIY